MLRLRFFFKKTVVINITLSPLPFPPLSITPSRSFFFQPPFFSPPRREKVSPRLPTTAPNRPYPHHSPPTTLLPPLSSLPSWRFPNSTIPPSKSVVFHPPLLLFPPLETKYSPPAKKYPSNQPNEVFYSPTILPHSHNPTKFSTAPPFFPTPNVPPRSPAPPRTPAQSPHRSRPHPHSLSLTHTHTYHLPVPPPPPPPPPLNPDPNVLRLYPLVRPDTFERLSPLEN